MEIHTLNEDTIMWCVYKLGQIPATERTVDAICKAWGEDEPLLPQTAVEILKKLRKEHKLVEEARQIGWTVFYQLVTDAAYQVTGDGFSGFGTGELAYRLIQTADFLSRLGAFTQTYPFVEVLNLREDISPCLAYVGYRFPQTFFEAFSPDQIALLQELHQTWCEAYGKTRSELVSLDLETGQWAVCDDCVDDSDNANSLLSEERAKEFLQSLRDQIQNERGICLCCSSPAVEDQGKLVLKRYWLCDECKETCSLKNEECSRTGQKKNPVTHTVVKRRLVY
jgi:hypothetical protein